MQVSPGYGDDRPPSFGTFRRLHGNGIGVLKGRRGGGKNENEFSVFKFAFPPPRRGQTEASFSEIC